METTNSTTDTKGEAAKKPVPKKLHTTNYDTDEDLRCIRFSSYFWNNLVGIGSRVYVVAGCTKIVQRITNFTEPTKGSDFQYRKFRFILIYAL